MQLLKAAVTAAEKQLPFQLHPGFVAVVVVVSRRPRSWLPLLSPVPRCKDHRGTLHGLGLVVVVVVVVVLV